MILKLMNESCLRRFVLQFGLLYSNSNLLLILVLIAVGTGVAGYLAFHAVSAWAPPERDYDERYQRYPSGTLDGVNINGALNISRQNLQHILVSNRLSLVIMECKFLYV